MNINGYFNRKAAKTQMLKKWFFNRAIRGALEHVLTPRKNKLRVLKTMLLASLNTDFNSAMPHVIVFFLKNKTVNCFHMAQKRVKNIMFTP